MKIRNEIEELFFKPNNIFKDDMDQSEKKKKWQTRDCKQKVFGLSDMDG